MKCILKLDLSEDINISNLVILFQGYKNYKLVNHQRLLFFFSHISTVLLSVNDDVSHAKLK